MSAETLNVILVIVTIVVAGYAMYLGHKRGETLTIGGAVTELKAAQPLAQELINVSTIAVQAAEQLKATGKLADNRAAFNYALNFIKGWFPATAGIDNDDIVAALESAVLVANALSQQIKNERPVLLPLPPEVVQNG